MQQGSRSLNAHVQHWPPDYVRLFAWRQRQLIAFRATPSLLAGAKAYYRDHPVEFICDWIDTYDPRNAGKEGKLTRMPLYLFERQRDLVRFLRACLDGEANGLIEKCRDAGATWVCVAFTVWLWLFWPGIAIGWGSRKEQLVDKLGVMDSIFEKIRMVIRGLPPEFIPAGFSEKDHMTYMRVINPENEATIIGEAGDNIGRGGRTRIYFKDESAWYERPELIEAALGDNTRCQIDISSVHGLGNVFHRKRESGIDWANDAPVSKERTNVFVFDWSDHPEKTPEWYAQRRARAEEEGLLHIFAQEVDRDYASSVEGVIIKPEWIRAAIDAHKTLELEDDGGWCAGLDVADGGMDKSALAQRKGIVLKAVEAWGEVDTGRTSRRALKELLFDTGALMYDSVGVGAGCKAEFNRLFNSEDAQERRSIPAGLRINDWNAGASVLFPEENLIRGDKRTPINKDYFLNLKAQAWWQLARRFQRTYAAVVEGTAHNADELISLDSEAIPRQVLQLLTKELSQATSGLSTGKLKWMVNKTPEGTRSPNMADAVVMAFWPVAKSRYTLKNLG
ncbi:terminase large subunit [Pseudanabaena phage Pam3]|nr:terminase large subunit [Pseudanabaena phage Pam3]